MHDKLIVCRHQPSKKSITPLRSMPPDTLDFLVVSIYIIYFYFNHILFFSLSSSLSNYFLCSTLSLLSYSSWNCWNWADNRDKPKKYEEKASKCLLKVAFIQFNTASPVTSVSLFIWKSFWGLFAKEMRQPQYNISIPYYKPARILLWVSWFWGVL